MNDLEASVLQVVEGYTQAVLDKDVEAFMRLYDENIQAFDAWTWSYEGAAAWRKMVEGWFSSVGTGERVVVTAEDVRVTATPGLAFLSASFRYAAVNAAGDTLRSLKNRLTWTLRREGGAWKIVHEHTSLPQ